MTEPYPTPRGVEAAIKDAAKKAARSDPSTQDIDLARRGVTLDQALDDLVRPSQLDLNDHFTFEHASSNDSVGAAHQPYTEGYEVKFNIYIGGASKSVVKVDLVVGTAVTGEVTTKEPASSLELPRLIWQ